MQLGQARSGSIPILVLLPILLSTELLRGIVSAIILLRGVRTSFYGTSVLRLTRVRAQPQKPACPSRVSASCPTSLHCSLFSGSSLQAPSCERCCQPLDCPCTNRSDLVGLDASSCKQPHWTATGIRSSARTRASLLRFGGLHTRKHTTTELGVCSCGPYI